MTALSDIFYMRSCLMVDPGIGEEELEEVWQALDYHIDLMILNDEKLKGKDYMMFRERYLAQPMGMPNEEKSFLFLRRASVSAWIYLK